MKPVSDALRKKIDALRRTLGNAAEPSWELRLFRDREKMLGLIDGSQITSGPPADVQPSLAQSSDGRYHVVFERAGSLYEMTSSPGNDPRITWGAPVLLFAGAAPDVDFDGAFATTGVFTSGDELLVYEDPAGSIKFRRYANGAWGSAVAVGAGQNPALVRGWADPPEVGTNDDGLIVFCTQSGALRYFQSADGGTAWSAAATIDLPAGGTKRNPQVFRLADYTLGIVYEYDNGLQTDVYFLKTTRRYVNIASPDETVRVGAGSFRHYEFTLFEVSAPSETVVAGAGAYRHGEFDAVEASAPGETVSVGAGGFRQVEFTGVNP